MAQKLHFDLVSPERLVYSAEAGMVTVPGSEGEFGVLAGHAPVVATLKAGVLTIAGGAGGTRRIFVDGGFAEVNPAGLTVLAETAVPVDELNAAYLDQQIRDAEDDVGLAKDDAARAHAEKMLARLKAMRAAA